MPPAKKYALTWGLTVMTSLVVMAGFTITVDPYRIWQTDPPWESSEPLMNKTRFAQPLAVVWQRPDVVLLGSSGVYNGMTKPTFINDQSCLLSTAGSTVFNYGVPGLCMEEAHAYVRHILNRTPTRSIVFGLDFFMFDPNMQPRSGFQPSILDSAFLLQQVPTSLFSMTALRDAAFVVGDNLSNLDSGENADSLQREQTEDFYANYYKYWHVKRTKPPMKPSRDAFQRLEDIVRRCKKNKVRLVLFFAPVHASILDAIHERWDGATFEAVKRRVTSLAEREKIELWDFATYNEATTSDLLDESAPYFSDPVHYKPKLGRRMLDRMRILNRAGDDAFTDFGTRLAPNDELTRTATRREEESQWLKHWAARRLRHAYEVGLRSGKYGSAVLLRRYKLNADPPRDILHSADGRRVTVLPAGHRQHGLLGAVDRVLYHRGQARVEGWVANTRQKVPIEEIAVFVDAEQCRWRAYWQWERTSRPELAERLGIPSLAHSGFSLAIPYETMLGRDVRIFAISGGYGIELTRAPLTPLPVRRDLEAISIACRPRYELQNGSKAGEALLCSDRRRIPVLGPGQRNHGIVGVIDRVEQRGPKVRFEGWALDAKQRSLVDDIVVLVDGRQFGARARGAWESRQRPRTAAKLGFNELVDNGYSVSIPLNSLRGFDRRVQIFAISGDCATELVKCPNLPQSLTDQQVRISLGPRSSPRLR
jgi:hypothetical protein